MESNLETWDYWCQSDILRVQAHPTSGYNNDEKETTFMTEHVNKLSNAQLERLAMLAEEASEVVQIAMKTIRHGYDSYNPYNPDAGSNKDMLYRELCDLGATMAMVFEDIGMVLGEGKNYQNRLETDFDNAYAKKKKFAHYQ